MKSCAVRFSLVGAMLGCAASLHAQSLPSAGSLQQQIEREQQIQKNQLERPGAKLKPLTEAPPQGANVVVTRFKFVGNTQLKEEALNQAVAGFLNRPLDFARLDAVAGAVMEAYRKQGWLAKAVLPPQDIDQGEVTLQITEASFGAAQIRSEPSTRVSSERILGIFQYQQPAGTPLNLDALDRALLLSDDLPGVTVSGSLTEGAREGQTNLVLQLADEPKLTASLASDNTGSVSTGANRVLANLTANSPSGVGDAMTLNILATGGTRYVRTGYSVPLGFDGWRLSANLSRLEYELIAAQYQALNARGSSNAWGLELSYPLVRGRSLNLNTTWAADLKTYFNQSGGSVVSSYASKVMSFGLNGTAFDELGGGGANSFSLTLSEGVLNLSGSPTQSAEASTTQTEGEFRKLRYSLSRQQQLSASWSLYGTLSGQWSDKNLDASEKFYLGGSTGVRAYPSNEGGGAWGQLAALELRSQLGSGYTLTAFYDWGQVTLNPRNDFTGASALNAFALKGRGLALGWQNTTGMSLKAVVSQRVGTNPNATTAGLDQDGTLHIHRVWLTASLAF